MSSSARRTSGRRMVLIGATCLSSAFIGLTAQAQTSSSQTAAPASDTVEEVIVTGFRKSLADEIALCRQYLSLEKLRLGERLAVDWQIEAIPPDTPVPPLMLQPLIENAVYHGIEPRPEGGRIVIAITRQANELQIRIVNPPAPLASHASGNQLALDNIRQRLALYFDLEARLASRVEVLKGSQSALYGGQAVGGVVSITSPRATGPGLQNSFLLEGGSFSTFRGAYTLTGMNDKGEFALSVNRFQTDGFSSAEEADGNDEDDGYRTTRLSGSGPLRHLHAR